MDHDGDNELTEAELEAGPATGGCFGGGKSLKLVTDLKDFFGDLFLLGLLTIVLVAWRGFGVKS